MVEKTARHRRTGIKINVYIIGVNNVLLFTFIGVYKYPDTKLSLAINDGSGLEPNPSLNEGFSTLFLTDLTEEANPFFSLEDF